MLDHRSPLDEQSIAQILQAVDAVEVTEEYRLQPPETAARAAIATSTSSAATTASASSTSASGAAAATMAPLEPCTLPIAPLEAPLSVLSARESAEGTCLVAGDSDGTLLLLRTRRECPCPLATGARTLPSQPRPATPACEEVWRARFAHRGSVMAAVIAPSGELLLSAGEDGSCAAWQLSANPPQAAEPCGKFAAVEPARRWRLDCPTADRVALVAYPKCIPVRAT